MESHLHPFVLTKGTIITLMDSCENGPPSDRCDDCRAWYDCCWMCVPCSFAVDIVICLPMTGICIYNETKNKCKCDKKSPQINPNLEKESEKKETPIVSSAPTALENPNLYEVK
jgi:hypothetical protein